MRLDCHVPVTVRVLGRHDAARLEALSRTLARVVAARLAAAERELARRPRRGIPAAGPVRERYSPRRAGPAGTVAVPGYDDGRGDPVHVPAFNAGRLLAEAGVYLGLKSMRDWEALRRIVEQYGSTETYAAFTEALRREHLDVLLPRLAVLRPVPARGLSADTIRMLYGPSPEEPDYWRSLSFEERRTPITVAGATRLLLHDRVEIIERPGDQADERVVIPDNRWEMTPAALRAFLQQMVGGRLTGFEELLVEHWNALGVVPQFDGPRVIGYYLATHGSVREHFIFSPDGHVVDRWLTEPGLVNEGLGPIEYFLAGRGLFRLGAAALRAGGRLALAAASTRTVRSALLSLRLTAGRLGRPLGAAMRGVEEAGVTGVGGGGPVPGLVLRESSAIRTAPAVRPTAPSPSLPEVVPRPSSTAPSPAAPSAAAPGSAVAPDTVRVLGVHAVSQGEQDDAALEREWDRSPSTATIAPGQGVVTTRPEAGLGLTADQIAANRRLLGHSIADAGIAVLAQGWNATARAADAAALTEANSRNLFDLHRDRFWRWVARTPAARQLLADAGWSIAGGAPFVMIDGRRVTITIDHILERQLAPQLALTAANLRLSFLRENTVVLRLLNQLDPFQ